MLAVHLGHVESIKVLVENGADLTSVESHFGWAPLHIAVAKNSMMCNLFNFTKI